MKLRFNENVINGYVVVDGKFMCSEFIIEETDEKYTINVNKCFLFSILTHDSISLNLLTNEVDNYIKESIKELQCKEMLDESCEYI